MLEERERVDQQRVAEEVNVLAGMAETVSPAKVHGASQAVRIAIIRTGKMGRGFASALSSRHEVVFGSRHPGRASKVVRSTGAAESSLADTAAEVLTGTQTSGLIGI
jgi:hypothetical protein